MGKAMALGEAIIAIKGIFDSTSDFFQDMVPDNFYELMDNMAFLNAKFLAVGSNGNMLDATEKIAKAVMNLSNLVIWGILIFYAFKSLFSYFLSKNLDVPWKFFVRMIIFGIMANAAFFICYTGIFFVENSTEYIRGYIGEKNASFLFLEDYIVEEDLDDEAESVYTLDVLISIFIYFSAFFVSICLGGRYLLIKVLILFSPIFFILGGFKSSEKFFYGWCKNFFILLFMQLFLVAILGIIKLCNLGNGLLSQILTCSMLLVFCKNILGFLKLSY